MSDHYPCIVVGLGAAGSAALYHLARRGVAAAGFDRFTPPHAMGSSHGDTRMIREAYYEDPAYVSLVRRAYDLWHALAAEAGTELIDETGGVFCGRPWEELIAGMRRSAGQYDIAVETLATAERERRFDWLRPDGDMVCLTEPRAGVLRPERCITAHLDGARRRGAGVFTDEPVASWHDDNGRVEVETSKRRFTTDRLILCAGSWMPAVAGDVGAALTVTRQTLFWYRPKRDARRLPVWAIEHVPGQLLYGFPDTGGGLKVAVHYGGAPTTADTVERTVDEDEKTKMRSLLDRYLPGLAGDLVKTAVCLYTNTPDHHFVVDTHPRSERVLVVSACCGHGFKFASAIGDAAAQWAAGETLPADLAFFSRARFDARA